MPSLVWYHTLSVKNSIEDLEYKLDDFIEYS